jgi:uncharacterized protein YggU (UPF0235/DUF167 family)
MKKFTIYLHPGSSKNKIEKLTDTSYKVYICEQPIDGKANEALIELFAETLGIPKSLLKITHGLKSKTKIIEAEL